MKHPFSKFFLFFQTVMICFMGSSLARAQQNSVPAGAGVNSPLTHSSSSSGAPLAAGVDASRTGSFAGQTVSAPLNPASSTSTNNRIPGEADSRSAWVAGSPGVAGAPTIGWRIGPESFSTMGGASWVAGANRFKLDRQPGGVWRDTPPSGVSLGAASQPAVLSAQPGPAPGFQFPTGLTSKGAAIIKTAGVPSPFPSRQSSGAANSFASHAGTLGAYGSRMPAHSTQQAPVLDTLTGPSLSGALGGSGTGASPAGASH
jgi:hypothetical protein